MLTLGKILRATPRNIWKNALGIKVRVLETRFGQTPSKEPFMETLLKAKSPKQRFVKKREVYTVIIRQYGPSQEALAAGGIMTTNKAWVHCSCPFFLFHCEVALAKQGSSSVIDSNGKPPVEKNPNMIPMMCKHIVATIAIRPHLKLPKVPGLEPFKLEVMMKDRATTKTEQKLLDLLGDEGHPKA